MLNKPTMHELTELEYQEYQLLKKHVAAQVEYLRRAQKNIHDMDKTSTAERNAVRVEAYHFIKTSLLMDGFVG